MKEIVLKVYKFDELSKDSQEKIIERERWDVYVGSLNEIV